MTRQHSLLWSLVTLALFSVFAREIATLGVTGLWFESVGHLDVFWTMFAVRAGAFVAGAGAMAGLLLLTLREVSRSASDSPIVLVDGRVDLSPWARAPQLARAVVQAVIVVASLMMGIAAQAAWMTWIAWWHATPFDQIDPVLGYDAGLYVFTLPAVETLRGLVMLALIVTTLFTGALYAVRGVVRVRLPTELDPEVRPSIRMPADARRHLGLLVALCGIVLAMGPFLSRFNAMSSTSGLFEGPGYTLVTVVLPLLSMASIATLIASFLAWRAFDTQRAGLAGFGMFFLFGVGVLQALVPDTIQRFVVSPNELELERPYIDAHIRATRTAWRLDGVEEERLGADSLLELGDIDNNRTTIEGIRLWDEGPLRDTFQQVQEIRTYYEFHHVDHDRYLVDGHLRQVMLSARELDPASLPEQARTWVNQTLVYTHGSGLTVGPVNEVTEDGLPVLWVKDIPPATDHDVFEVSQPAIYFGEEMRKPVIVNTSQAEFDYPTAEGNETTRYVGAAGVPVGGLARRALLAMVLNEFDILLNGDIQDGSRLLWIRNVRERVQTLAPFLWVDEDAYLAVLDGRLVWFLDGFTHSDRYPYSAHRRLPSSSRGAPSANWVRNRVKITVDAYDGTVTMYRMPGDDPVLDAWTAAFPNLILPAAEMPEAVRAHIRVPDSLFEVQAHLFATYHMTNPETFYNREDEWEVPSLVEGSGMPRTTNRRGQTIAWSMRPYFTVMKLPREGSDEFILMLPFTPRDKDNLSAWMVARNDGEHYGTLRVYRFPKDRLVYGPSQVVARIQQDDAISEKLTLWSQQGSGAILGTLLVIPVEESLLYVQPLYLRADEGAIPELKRVIVGYRDAIAMEPTLEGALARLFDAGAGLPDPTPDASAPSAPSATWQQAVQRARQHWDAVQSAAQNGQFGAMGEALDRLGASLHDLAIQVDGEPAPDGGDTDAGASAAE